ncbi:MAG: hypothetical protein ACPGJV_12975 [Bacteriovoracaceae bacterium]
MQKLILLPFFLITLTAHTFTDPKIAGIIAPQTYENGKIVPGLLKVELYRFNKNQKPSPVARFEYKDPRWPQAFSVGPKNLIDKSKPLRGEFRVKVIFQSSKGKEFTGQTSLNQKVLPGTKNLKIQIK